MNRHNDREETSQSFNPRALPFGALRCFEAAARLESFTRAGQELHLTHGAISRAVRTLEDVLGLALFERRHQRVFLTPAGARLRDATAAALDLIDTTARELHASAQPPALALSCEPTLLMRWLIPRLPDFKTRHPDITLRLVAGGGTPSFQGIDLAIRRNDFDWGGNLHAEWLFEERTGPVGSPRCRRDWIGKRNERPCLRQGLTLLHSATRPNAWETWSRASGEALPDHGSQTFEHFYFSLQAAAAGIGPAIGPWQLVRDDIDAGLLEAPFGFVPDGSAYHLLAPSPIEADSPAGALLAWLRSMG